MAQTDWQFNRSVVDCNKYMLEKQLVCDVVFRVGPSEEMQEEIHAHKYCLMSRSPVFFAMFHGDLSEPSGQPIVVPDVEAEAFRQMIVYLYTDVAQLTSDSVLPTLYASKKYMIPALTAQCFSYLEDNLNADNVCLILEQSVLYDEASLTLKCNTFIETRTDEVLKASSFTDLSQASLMKLLEHSSLTVTELEIFVSCCSWAKEECRRCNLDATPQNKRTVLGDILYLIHFPCIPIKDFSKHVSRTGILSAEERCAIFEYLATDSEERKSIETIPFPTQPRTKSEPYVLQRFTNFCRTVIWSGDCSTFKMNVDKAVVIKGFGFSGSMSYDPVAEIQFTIKHNRDVLMSSTMSADDNQSGDTIHTMLPRGVPLKPSIWYSVTVAVHFFGDNDQGYCRRGKGGNNNNKITTEGVTFEFDRNDSGTGFILEILFCR